MKCVKFRSYFLSNICIAAWGIIKSQYSWIRIVSGPLCVLDFFLCHSTVNESTKTMDGKEPTAQPPSECVCAFIIIFYPISFVQFEYLKLNYYPSSQSVSPSEQQQERKQRKNASCNVKPKEKRTTRNVEHSECDFVCICYIFI